MIRRSKILLILVLVAVSLPGWGQDTLKYDYGTTTAVTGWAQINSSSIIDGTRTVTTDYASNTSLGVAHESYPTGVGEDALYTGGDSTKSVIENITEFETATVEVFCANQFAAYSNDVYINNVYRGTISVQNNTSSLIVEDVAVGGDSIKIVTIGNGGNNAYINAVVIYEYQAPTYCDTVTYSASAVVTGSFTLADIGTIDQTVISPQSVTHLWNDGVTTEDRTGLAIGSYTDTITMVDSGCVLIKTYNVPELDRCDTVQLDITIDNTVHIQKGEASNVGAIYISVSGDYEPFTYLWSNAETTQDITGLTEGEYSVIVTDNSGCEGYDTINIIDFNNTTETFLATFESQSTDADIGSNTLATSNNGNMYVVPNPSIGGINTSSYVLRTVTPPGVATRAEYTINRHETNEKKYVYQWKRYHPVGLFTDVQVNIAAGILINQWKTWPCEAFPGPEGDPIYEPIAYTICDGGGIFNDMDLLPDNSFRYRSRALPNCNADYWELTEGQWQQWTLEIYWTTTEDGYYRIWLDDVLFGYSDNMKTLFDGFLESTCDVFLGTGLYGSWSQTGGLTTDSLRVYIDDVTLYDVDSGYTITNVCPTCEIAPEVPTDTMTYKININSSSEQPDHYNNYIAFWRNDTSRVDFSNTYGQNKGYDIYMWDDDAHPDNSLADSCFPEEVIQTSMYWQDSTVRHILFRELDTSSTYTVRIHSATENVGTNQGIQIWSTGVDRDTVLAEDNLCEVAELNDLSPTNDGDLIINVKSIDDASPRPYINSIELVEYAATESTLELITVGVDTTLYMWSVKQNLGIDETNERLTLTLEKVEVGSQHTYKKWCDVTNRWADQFPSVTDTLNHQTDTLGRYRDYVNEILILEGTTEE